jgi:hypothetical protein
MASIILILAAFGSRQLVRGQATPVLGAIRVLPGLGRVEAINKSGQIAGQSGSEEVMGVLTDQSGKVAKAISVPGSVQTLIYGMNNNAQIVGGDDLPDHAGAHGFVYDKGTFTAINYPGGTDTKLRGINDLKQIVGDYNDSAGHRHGFLFNQGSFTPIDVPGAVNTFVYGLNNAVTIVGYFTDGQGHQHGFVTDHKGISTMDVPFSGATDTFVYGINNPGTIVGSYIDGKGTHGFVNVQGSFLSIDAPGTPPGIGTFARSVNDNGQVLLYGTEAAIVGIH